MEVKTYLRTCILMTILVFTIFTVNATWWDANWMFKQEITLTSTTNSAQNYTVHLILNSSNVGTGFNWNNECSNNQSRIRFIDSTNTNELPFWVEECSVSNQNMSIWVKSEESILTTGTLINLYYGNTLATFKSNPEDAFDFYMNFSTLTMQSETSGASQDASGNGNILDSGRTFHTWGNSWKVFSGIDSYQLQNTGTQILEINMKSTDCGEIVGNEFDNDATQTGAHSYRWCGTQTSWGAVPDKQYTGGGNWQTVYTILNDFTTTPTHIHFPIDDDADASGDVYFKDFRIRKYLATEPTYLIGTENVINTTVQSLSPINNYSTNNISITFICNAATINTTTLKNISLYGNWGSGWHLNETKSLSGQVDSETFTKTFTETSANYKWNCKVYDNAGFSDWYDSNHTLILDKEAPQINIINPQNTIQDFTPTLNISFSKNVNAWYNINDSTNITLCNDCSSIDTKGLYLSEGNYKLNIYANDSNGNYNSTIKNFNINMNKKYTENFNDNFSIENLNGNNLGNGNLTFAGTVKKYNGIEIGYTKTSITFHPNQWGGSSNTGEVDITCPGGDINCWFEKQDGTNVSTPTIINGVTTDDGESSTVGFIMYSATDIHSRWSGMHAQQSDHYVAVCYISGQWYYDDNNVGCTLPFTPVASDVLVANLTWGINAVSGIQTTAAAQSYITTKQLNLSHNITKILNVTWDKFDTDSNNQVLINLSLDNGNTWFNTTNGLGIENVTQNNSLIVKIHFTTDGTKYPGLYNFTILWDNVITQKPFVNITYPKNLTKIIGNQINITWNITDNENDLNCSIYVDGILNKTQNCSSININNLLYNFTRGIHSVYVNANDSENFSVNSDIIYFATINPYNITQEKSIKYENTNMYKIKIIGRNIIDFVSSLFISGSFNPNFNWSDNTGNEEYLGWNKSINNIEYSISGSGNYKTKNNYVIGID